MPTILIIKHCYLPTNNLSFEFSDNVNDKILGVYPINLFLKNTMKINKLAYFESNINFD